MLRTMKSAAIVLVAVSVAFFATQAGAVALKRGNAAEPDSLDPHKAQGTWEADIIGDMILGLTTEDAKAEPIPGSAKEWSVSEDGLVWTFKLDERVTWSDGTPVTADDFVFAWRRLLDPKTVAQYASILYVVKNAREVNGGALPLEELGVRAADPMTFEVALTHPAPYLTQLTMHQAAFPVPKHLVEKVGDDWVKAGTMISNGPYVLAEWIPNDRVRLVKNQSFYDAANVKIDEVFFFPTADTSAAMKRLRAGELDMQRNFPAGQIDFLKQNMAETVRVFPFLNVAYLVFNVKRPPFDDVRVREALSLTMNRELINDSIFKLGESAAYSFVPPGTANYPSTAAVKFKDMPEADRITRAKELLSQAGFGPNNPLTFKFNTMVDNDLKRSAVAIQQMWTQAGAKVTIENNEPKVHYTVILQQHNFDVAYAAWVADYNDADNFLFMLESDNSGFNYGQWFNNDYDALMAKAYKSKDLAERGQFLTQAEQLLLDDHGVAPMRFPFARYLVAPHVKGFEPNMRQVFRTRWLSIEGPRFGFKGADETAPAGDAGRVETGGEQTWGQWFSGIMCSWFGLWCTA